MSVCRSPVFVGGPSVMEKLRKIELGSIEYRDRCLFVRDVNFPLSVDYGEDSGNYVSSQM